MEHEGERTPRIVPVSSEEEHGITDLEQTERGEERRISVQQHEPSTPRPTDSMVTVPLSESGISTTDTNDGEAGERDSTHRRSASLGADSENGSGYDSDDVMVEEASVATRAPMSVRTGSVAAPGGSSSVAESSMAKTKSPRQSGVSEHMELWGGSADGDAESRPSIDRQDTNWPSTKADGDNLPVDGTLLHDSESLSAAITDTPPEESAPDETSTDDRGGVAARPGITVDTAMARSRPTSIEILRSVGSIPKGRGSVDLHTRGIDRISTLEIEETLDMIEEAEEIEGQEQRGRRRRSSSPLDWAKLDRTEEQEVREADETGDEQTALLLARLEQENAAIAIDPKAGLKSRARKLTASRPPSMADLKSLVKKNHRNSIRVSRMPSPPPMTELDFWAALVKDYPSTAQRLPTLTSNKIRAGIPPPLRGVVWVSMAGARDGLLEDQYDRLCGESSPYENIISKDIGRSFPGVEMFRDADGEGQKMLGRVLKCFSLHDDKIGYCQGLGFLVGPLLMQMGERDAFCVLVRLMEDYDLHSCFQPDLSGLHLCIYQFQELLTQHLPVLAAHLAQLQVEAAYLSQWFLSFFAVTCPLPMLFRIYDVIFAEGASETIMRVALSVMRRNEQRIMALSEFEDVMQLLLSRALWDPYGLSAKSADELVSDFVSFSSLVTRENLRELDARFKATQAGGSPTRSGFFPEAQNAASRFLGRLWAPSGTPTKATSSTLSPDSATTPGATSRPCSLRRTPSKQSLASTHTTETGTESTMSPSSSGTALTTFSRITSDDYETSVESPKTQSESLAAIATTTSDRDLHCQIEDLLTALSEMQRAHTQLAAQLAKEREEREEDCSVVRSLLDGLAQEKRKTGRALEQEPHGRRRTVPTTRGPATLENAQEAEGENLADAKRVSNLIASAEHRFPFPAAPNRRSAGMETKSQLRSALTQARENAASESMRAADLSQQVEAKDQETTAMREQLREARTRAQTEFGEKQRLEKTIAELRQELRQAQHGASSTTGIVNRMAQGLFDQSAAATDSIASAKQSQNNSDNSNGLREFKLGRANTSMTPQQFSKRSSSLVTHAVLGSLAGNSPPLPSVPSAMSTASSDGSAPASSAADQHDRDAMLLELVNAKTAEAIARQELDEMKGRYESMRKMLGQQPPATPSTSSGTTTAPTPAAAGHKPRPSEGWVSYVSGAARDALASATVAATSTNEKITTAVTEEKPKAHTSGGGFWGWGKRT